MQIAKQAEGWTDCCKSRDHGKQMFWGQADVRCLEWRLSDELPRDEKHKIMLVHDICTCELRRIAVQLWSFVYVMFLNSA